MAQDVSGELQRLLRRLVPAWSPGATVDPDRGEIVVPLGRGERARLSTARLEAACSRQPRHGWAVTAEVWLAAVLAELAATRPGGRASPEQLRARVRPRLPDEVARSLLTVPFGSHFDVVVVRDRARTLELLTRGQAAELGLDARQAASLAVRQTIVGELAGLDVRDHALPGGVGVRMLAIDGSPYVSTTVLSIPRFAGGELAHGALVAVPRYSTVLLHRVVTAAVLGVLPAFAQLAGSMHQEAADPCCERVFWWLDGTLHPVAPAAAAQRLRLPERLAATVRSLPRA